MIGLLDSSGDEISADELEDMEEQKEGDGMEELPGMPEGQDDTNLGTMPIATHATASHSPSRTVQQEDQDLTFTMQNN